MSYMANIEPFEGLSKQLIDEINQVGIIRNYPKGSSAMDSDDTLRSFYILIEGRIKVYQYNPNNNREQTI